MNRGHSSLWSHHFGNIVIYLTNVAEILILFLPIHSLNVSYRQSFHWFAEAVI